MADWSGGVLRTATKGEFGSPCGVVGGVEGIIEGDELIVTNGLDVDEEGGVLLVESVVVVVVVVVVEESLLFGVEENVGLEGGGLDWLLLLLEGVLLKLSNLEIRSFGFWKED